jgi:hypothetical protein
MRRSRRCPASGRAAYKSASGKEGRVFTSLYGTSEDITNEGYRRLLVNGMLLGARAWKTQDQAGPEHRLRRCRQAEHLRRRRYARGIKPEMYAGFESPIPANNNTKKPEDQEGRQEDKGAKKEEPKSRRRTCDD